jgi:hypothetical protein
MLTALSIAFGIAALVGFWFLVALATAILALGPILRLGGQIQLLAGDRYIFLPYFLATKIPLLEWGRTPARLHFTTMFALMILAGYGLRYLLGQWKRPLAQTVLATAVLVLILVIVHAPYIHYWRGQPNDHTVKICV